MERERLRLIDALRGFTIVNMVLFHLCYDLYIYDLWISEDFLFGPVGTIWERYIAISFISISGYCFSFSKNHLRRGLITLSCGLIITLVTLVAVPDEKIIFGILWFIGSAMLIMIPLDYFEGRIESNKRNMLIRFISMLLLFVLFYRVNDGYIGLAGKAGLLPYEVYRGYFMTYLGFTDPTFSSSDYFSILPWIFIFIGGYLLEKILRGTDFSIKVLTKGCRPLEYLGRHSLIIYMLHQVVLYGLVTLLAMIL